MGQLINQDSSWVDKEKKTSNRWSFFNDTYSINLNDSYNLIISLKQFFIHILRTNVAQTNLILREHKMNIRGRIYV